MSSIEWPTQCSSLPDGFSLDSISLISLVKSLNTLTSDIDLIRTFQKILFVLIYKPDSIHELNFDKTKRVLDQFTTLPDSAYQYSAAIRRLSRDISNILSSRIYYDKPLTFSGYDLVQMYSFSADQAAYQSMLAQQNQLLMTQQMQEYGTIQQQLGEISQPKTLTEGKGAKRGKAKRRPIHPDSAATFVVKPANSDAKIVLHPSDPASYPVDMDMIENSFAIYPSTPHHFNIDFTLLTTDPTTSLLQGKRAILTKDNTHSIFMPSTIIQRGIFLFECVFNQSSQKRAGIIEHDYIPTDDEYLGKSIKTLGYTGSGFIQHGTQYNGNAPFEDGKRIGLQVNMDSTPRTLHFFVAGVQQPVVIVNIPSSLRFCTYLYREHSMVDMWLVELLSPLSVEQPHESRVDWNASG
ncbi:hypothetical protein BLNAU_3736 [Blattamonas nauphoetae]|uniref:SPRY domain-containing protein n=1 Tax=Blattamonas nauphoetae TaxID=2049346 RepID=A0ABQ9YC41_9EUKA|nr:hypothetical protein BLNAU_3736 [Blattamonas nauphoetae]